MAYYVPTESEEQQSLISWVRRSLGNYPELNMLYHVTNEGKRSPVTGARLKAEGLQPGVPDLCLAVARGEYHGLYIEMKRTKGGRVSPEQARWIEKLSREGYVAVVCRGWEQAREAILRYLAQ
jgi:hypothetical protein